MSVLPDRLRLNIDITDDACWQLTRYVTPEGYGRLIYEGTRWLAHRLSYVLLVGPIPEGLVIDHLCRNRACINPAHMEPVTPLENFLRGKDAIERCPKGHPYDRGNINVERRTDGRQTRRCRTCRLAEGRAYQQARRDRTAA